MGESGANTRAVEVLASYKSSDFRTCTYLAPLITTQRFVPLTLWYLLFIPYPLSLASTPTILFSMPSGKKTVKVTNKPAMEAKMVPHDSKIFSTTTLNEGMVL